MAENRISFTCPHCGKATVYTQLAEEPPPPQPPELSPEEKYKSVSIDVLNLSVRAYNCLYNAGIKTVGELIQRKPEEVSHLGRGTFNEVWDCLESMNLSLRGARADWTR